MNASQSTMRALVRGAYDIQKLRIQVGLRVVANWKAKEGHEPGTKEEDTLGKEAKELIKNLLEQHSRLTDGITTLSRRKAFKGTALISSRTEFDLIESYVRLLDDEKQHFKAISYALEEFAIWTHFLQGVKGCGPAMAGVIISEIDIHKARYPSSLWKYAGLDVASDGRGRSRRKEHLVEVEYIDKDGKPAKRMGITFNPFLKTKLVGVLGGSFLKAGGDNVYERVYRDQKHRLEHHEKYKDVSKGHRHNMATRYAVKLFLTDLHCAWRELENLPVSVPYAEAKLSIKHREDVA